MKQRLTILIVDNHRNDAGLIVSELKKAGLEPQWKRVGNKLDFLTEMMNLTELICPDASVQHFSGLQAAQLLLESGLKIPFTRVSVAGAAEALETLKQGDTDYLFKNQGGHDRVVQDSEPQRLRQGATITATGEDQALRGELVSRKIRCWGRSADGEEGSYLVVINSSDVKEPKRKWQ